jgi:hypothetical protein
VDTDPTQPFENAPGMRNAGGKFTSDALALAWREGIIFAVDARTIARDGAEILRSAAPVTIEIRPDGIVGCLASPAAITVRSDRRPAAVYVNGQPSKAFKYDDTTKQLTLTLPAGDFRIDL